MNKITLSKSFSLMLDKYTTYFNLQAKEHAYIFFFNFGKMFFFLSNLILGSGFMRQKTCRIIAVCTREENEQMSIESIFLVADCSNAIYQHHFDLSLNKLLAKQKESLYASARLENSASSVRRFKIRHGNFKKKNRQLFYQSNGSAQYCLYVSHFCFSCM